MPDITLRSMDNVDYVVDELVAFESITVKNIVEDASDGGSRVISLHNVSSAILEKIIQYCTYHVSVRDNVSQLQDGMTKAWDADYVNLDQKTMFELILAADYMNIPGIMTLLCQTVADMITGKTTEVRQLAHTHCRAHGASAAHTYTHEWPVMPTTQLAFSFPPTGNTRTL
jgi:S-phase kinase-associated protein 1